MQFEYVKHKVLGKDLTFVLDRDNTDWYMETMRKKPFSNPVHHHLVTLLRKGAFDGSLKYADFGANIGVTSYFAAALGIETLAVEAGRSNFAMLTEAKRSNGFGSEYRPVFMAASDHKGALYFSENSAWGAISTAKEGSYTVDCDTIANILNANGFADAQLIKVDIEGAELKAMTGFEAIVAQGSAPDIIMESNEPACERNNYSCQDLWSRMIALGYNVYQLGGATLVPLTAAAAQDVQVADILATKRSVENLQNVFGYKIVPYSDDTAKTHLEELLQRAPEKKNLKAFVERQMAVLQKASRLAP